MYNVSQAYLNALDEPIQDYKLKISIDGREYDGSKVVGGSLAVKNQCSDVDIVQIGSVYSAELTCTFDSSVVIRGHWEGAQITVSEGMDIGGNTFEYVPLGVFTVAQADHTAEGVAITAYDNMLKFDKTWSISTTIGSPWNILRMLCNDCRVSNGMTQAQVEAFANGTQPLALYSENDCETYRDVLYWLCQTLAVYATIGRDGRLYLREYKSTSNITMINTEEARYEGGSFSDFTTAYTGIAYTYMPTQEYVYDHLETDDKLTYNLGSNPFLQYGTETTRKAMVRNILNKLAVINYTPFRTGYLNTPAYDLGDVLRNTGGIADDSISCIMSYEYSFQNGYTCEGFGQNPALATARDKVDKELAGIMSKTDKNGIQFYTFKNADEDVIEDGERKELIYIRFTTMEARQVTFQAEILADSEATVDEVEAQIEYFLDGAVVSDYKPTETWTEDGKHIINLYYMLDVEPNHLYQWQVKMTANGGTITIPQGHARGTVWGQGLVAIGAWDGFIDVEDTVTAIPLDSIYVAMFTDAVSVEAQIPIAINIADQLTSITLDSIDVAEFEDYVLVNKASLYFKQMTWGDVKEYLWQEIKDGFTW